MAAIEKTSAATLSAARRGALETLDELECTLEACITAFKHLEEISHMSSAPFAWSMAAKAACGQVWDTLEAEAEQGVRSAISVGRDACDIITHLIDRAEVA